MWIFFGTKDNAELVPGGRREQRTCPKCGEHAMFYERRVISSMELYLIPIFDYRTRLVMACGACGSLFATDEPAPGYQPQSDTDKITSAAERTAESIASAAKEGFARMSDAVKTHLGSSHSERPPEPEPPLVDTDDPLADDERALEAKFRELEKRMRVPDK